MVRLVLKNPNLLQKSMEIISELVMEGTFVFKKDYLELVALNSNNVVMVIFRLLSSNFEEYEVKEDTKLSLNLEKFSDVLKRTSDGDKLILEMKEGINVLKILSSGKNPKEFELSLIDVNDANLQNVPKLEFDAKIITSSSFLTSAVNDLNFLENGVNFNVKKGKFFIDGKTNSMSGRVDFNENVDVKVKEDKDIFCRYSIEYLKKFIKTEKIVNTVELSFSTDYPLKIEYKLVDRLLLGFILAPRGDD